MFAYNIVENAKKALRECVKTCVEINKLCYNVSSHPSLLDVEKENHGSKIGFARVYLRLENYIEFSFSINNKSSLLFSMVVLINLFMI